MNTREDTVNKFMVETVYPAYLEHLSQFKKTIYENKEAYISLITQAFEAFCQRILIGQEKHGKEEIRYISISCLYTALFQENKDFVITGHDYKGYYGETQVSYYFDTSSYLSPLVTLRKSLLEKCKPYLHYRDVLESEVEKLVLSGFRQYVEAFVQIIRMSCATLIGIESFKLIKKHEEFQLIAGEYTDRSVLIYSVQNTYSTNEKCSYRLAFQKDKVIHGFYQKGFIAENIFYDVYDFRYSIIPDAQFNNCAFTKCIMSNTTFSGSRFEKVDFSESIGHDAIFNKCHFKSVKCNQFYSDSRVVEGLSVPTGFMGFQCRESVLECVDFSNSIFYGADFQDTHFIDCNFSSCDLSMANFKGSRFENVNFENATLAGAYISSCNGEVVLSKHQINELRGR